ncbi:MAG TPA: efflux RND transporter periplasmic adaptor subunit, partial [Actinomycetales bacterium]
AAAGGAGGGTTSGGTTLAVGAPVGSGAPLATITDASVLTVTAEVDETDVLRLKAGTKADVTVDAVPEATYAATVRSIDPSPTTGTAGSVTYTARMSFDGGRIEGRPAPAPLPGMSAVVSLRVAGVRDAVRVPPAAVVRSGEGGADAVWVVSAGRALLRPVTVGLRGDDAVQLLSGVRTGDTIVVEGMDQLDEGDQVR